MKRLTVAAVLFCFAATVPSCGSAPPAAQSKAPAAAPSAGKTALDRAAALTPRPLSEVTQPWMLEKKPGLEAAVAKLKEALGAVEQAGTEDLRGLFALGHAANALSHIEAELKQATCNDDCLQVRIRAFRTIDNWSLLLRMFSVDTLIPRLAQALYPSAQAAQIEEYKLFWNHLIEHSGPQWRRLAAERVQAKSTSKDDKAKLYYWLMMERIVEGANADARWFGERALQQGTGNNTDTRSWLARACYRQLDVTCGDRYRSELAGTPSGDGIGQEALQSDRDHALAAVALKDKTDLLSRLKLGNHLVELERFNEARSVAESLSAKHPRDARISAMQASILLRDKLDFAGAKKLLVAADSFEHRDEMFFQLRIGLLFEAMKSMMSDPETSLGQLGTSLDALAPVIKDYAAINYDRGNMLDIGLALGRVALAVQRDAASQAELSAALNTAIAAVAEKQKGPKAGVHLRRFQLILARLDKNPERAAAAIGAVPGYDELEGLHAQLTMYMALARGTIDQALVTLATPKSEAAREARLALVVARANRDGDNSIWGATAADLAELQAGVSGVENAIRMANNRIVTAYRMGQGSQAKTALVELLKPAEDKLAEVAFNHQVTEGKFSQPKADDSMSAKILAAHRQLWKQRVSSTSKPSFKKLAARLRTLVPDGDTGLVVRGEFGVTLQNTFQVGLGYSERERLAMSLEITSWPVFILPAYVDF